MLSKSGRCRTFDAGADGFVRGEGCGMIVLKRRRLLVRRTKRMLGRGSMRGNGSIGIATGIQVPNAVLPYVARLSAPFSAVNWIAGTDSSGSAPRSMENRSPSWVGDQPASASTSVTAASMA